MLTQLRRQVALATACMTPLFLGLATTLWAQEAPAPTTSVAAEAPAPPPSAAPKAPDPVGQPATYSFTPSMAKAVKGMS